MATFQNMFLYICCCLLVSELVGVTSFNYMLIASLIFTYGRIAHAICFAFFDYNPLLRISGMLTTYVGIFMLSIKLIIFYIQII